MAGEIVINKNTTLITPNNPNLPLLQGKLDPQQKLSVGVGMNLILDEITDLRDKLNNGQVGQIEVSVSNIGTTGVGIFAEKSGTELKFKKIAAGNNAITVSQTSDIINVAFDKQAAQLDLVNNTPDIDKPISSATHLELNKRPILTSGKLADGVIPTNIPRLDNNNKLLLSQMPDGIGGDTFVYYTAAADTAPSGTGEADKIYVNRTDDKEYRWDSEESNFKPRATGGGITGITFVDALGTTSNTTTYTLDKAKVGLSNADNKSMIQMLTEIDSPIKLAFDNKQNRLEYDTVPTVNSDKLIRSKDLKIVIDAVIAGTLSANSPTLTGVPKSVTPIDSSPNDMIATKQFVLEKAANVTVSGMASVNTISALSTYSRGSQNVVAVGDGLGGGIFRWISSGTSNNFTTFAASGSGIWSRQFESGIYEAAWSTSLSGANDMVKLQAMINALPDGAILRLRANATYSHTTGLLITKPITLLGNGATLDITALSTAITIRTSNVTIDGVKMKSISKDKDNGGSHGIKWINPSNDQDTASMPNGYPAAPYVNGTIINCTLDGFSTGIYTEYVNNLKVDYNKIYNSGYAAISILACNGGTVNYNYIDRVWSTNRSTQGPNGDLAYGIALNCIGLDRFPVCRNMDCNYNIIKNVFTWEGLDTHAGEDLNFIGNKLYDCKRAIAITEDSAQLTGRSCKRILIELNEVYNETWVHSPHCVYLYANVRKDGEDVIIRNNKFVGAPVNMLGYKRVTISNNKFIRSMSTALSIQSSCNDINVIDNEFIDIIGVNPISVTLDSGLGTKAYGNTMSYCIDNDSAGVGVVRGNWSTNTGKVKVGDIMPAKIINYSNKSQVLDRTKTITSINGSGYQGSSGLTMRFGVNNFDGIPAARRFIGATRPVPYESTGAPNMNLPNGSPYTRLDPGIGTSLYIRQNDTWVAK